ncbi:efflux RND transporter permease subunit [Pedobacter cryophilus]|uniref:Efflux RND transporter permease subunit n=1 Tax=Pedobacter cryophilus TaxID=2571271 RepID=A0A4U1C4I2_9SPHI|nr:efflux RND transporter permease subunit [Pedobacter cryophilus]TKB99059.1 efflux RND transporter permease subunit [Pedobacter cryophilus]
MKDLDKEFKPSSWAIENRTAIYVLTVLLLLAGYFAYNSLPKENFPEISIPKIFVRTIYPGTSPANMENLVTKQLEKQLKSAQGLKKVTSNSYQDFSFITAEFNANVDIKDAKQRIKDAVDKAKTDLPSDLPDDPEVLDINLSDLPIMYLNISGDFDLKTLKKYADDLQDRVESLPEISGVDIVGALDPEVQINVDVNKMSAAQLSFYDIQQAIGTENISASGGTVPIDGVRRTLNIKKEYGSAEEISNTIIKSPTGSSIYLRDIANVVDGFKEQESYARLNGKNVITLNVKKRSGQNLIEASDKIREIIAEMKVKQFPKGLEIVTTGDQSDKTRVTLHDLINTIVIGFILVTLILMFFMGITNALFVALSVPLSMCVAFLIMPTIGFTMNMIVLFSFLLALGIVVDDAIVVIENTHRIFDNGKVSIKHAAKMAAGEVFLPVFSGTMTTLAPFIPLAFWPGVIGEFMFFLPITLIITLLASLVVAYIINPVFAVDFMESHAADEVYQPTFDKKVKKTLMYFGIAAVLGYLVGFAVGNFVVIIALFYLLQHFVLEKAIRKFQNHTWPKAQEKYTKFLIWTLHRPYAILGSTLGLLIFSIVLTGLIPPRFVFFPSSDPNFVYVYTSLPVGTDQAYTNEVTKKIEQKVTAVVDSLGKQNVSSIISNVTVGVTDPQDEDQGNYPNKSKVTVSFVEFGERTGKSSTDYLTAIRNSVKGIAGTEISVTQEQAGPPTAKPVSIEITGDDLDSLVKTSIVLKNYLVAKRVGGLEELKSDFQNNKPEIIFDIDRERANREGVATRTAAFNLRTALYGTEVSKFRDLDEDYEINVRAQEDQRNNLEALRNLKMTFRDMGMGGQIRQVPLSSFANIDYVNTYGGIKRKQQKRIIILSSNVLKDFNENEVVKNIQTEINDFKAPDGVLVKMAGAQEEQAETANFLGLALGVAFFLILIILVIQFNSIGKPLIILSEIVFSIIGVLLGITIFQMEMSIVMMGIGIVALAGIVVRNGILLVEFADLMMEQGMEAYEAVLEAGRTRMTPVLLTATATMLGLIPLAVGLNLDFAALLTTGNPHIYFGGDNVAFWGPLSWTMIFGLSFATFLTLILVPSMYLIRVKIKNRLSKKNKTTDPVTT